MAYGLKKRERQEETQTYTEGEGEGKGRYKLMQGIGLFNCYGFPVPAEKWGEGVLWGQLGILENLCFRQQ